MSVGKVVGEQGAAQSLARAYKMLGIKWERRRTAIHNTIEVAESLKPQDGCSLKEESQGEDIANLPSRHKLRPDQPHVGQMEGGG